MSTSAASVVSHFPSPQNGFTTTLASTIASGAATVPLNSVAGYTNGQIAVFVVDPTDTSKKQTFTGTIDTAGVQVTSVVWTAGTNQIHSAGSTVVDYATATHIAMITKGLLVSHNQDGTIKNNAITTAAQITDNIVSTTELTTELQKGWEGAYSGTTFPAPNTVTANGNHSYSLVFNSTDLSGAISPGMRLRTTRTVAAPNQCTSLNGTTQYYSKSSPSGMTFTNFPVVSAWIKLTAYSASQQTIASRYNGTSGWDFQINPSGQVALYGFNAGAANFNGVVSYQSVPLNEWVHVTAQLDMSTATLDATHSYVLIDGISVPVAKSTGGTAPTALIQAGNLEVGGRNGGLVPFGGKIAQLAIYSAAVAQATIIASMNQTVAGTETSEVSAYSFNNTINDLNVNANNLTANGSAVATNADSPFGGQAGGTISTTLDYGIIQSVTFSTNTTVVVQVAEGCTIPTSGGVSAISYSALGSSPYGFPRQKEKWLVKTLIKVLHSQSTPTLNQWYNLTSTSGVSGGEVLSVPIGSWNYGYMAAIQSDKATTTSVDVWSTLSTANNTEADPEMTSFAQTNAGSSTLGIAITVHRVKPLTISAQTSYYLNLKSGLSAGTIYCRGDNSVTKIFAENSLL